MILDDLAEIRDGLRWGLSTNLELSDDSLEYNLFEQFEPFVWSSLHSDSLRPLFLKGAISQEHFEQLQDLRKLWVENIDIEKTASEVRRTDSSFRQAMDITDQLWKELERYLSSAGRFSPAVYSEDDTRPRCIPL
jgi:hypothetical protein